MSREAVLGKQLSEHVPWPVVGDWPKCSQVNPKFPLTRGPPHPDNGHPRHINAQAGLASARAREIVGLPDVLLGRFDQSTNCAPSSQPIRHASRHWRGRPSDRIMVNSGGISRYSAITFPPPSEISVTVQSRGSEPVPN